MGAAWHFISTSFPCLKFSVEGLTLKSGITSQCDGFSCWQWICTVKKGADDRRGALWFPVAPCYLHNRQPWVGRDLVLHGRRISLALVPNSLLGPRGLGSLLGRVPHQRRGLD